MVFSSLVFIFSFLPLTLLAYYLAPGFLRNPVLLLASLLFYSWGEPKYVLIMAFTTAANYALSILIDRYRGRRVLRRALFLAALAADLGILCFFKYSGFLADNLKALCGLELALPDLPLPLGISFYTFQTMSYVIDVYLGKVRVQRNIISFGTYITMFPQLVAGPIVKYGEIAGQLAGRKESLQMFGEGAGIFLIGLAKKVLLANNIGMLWDTVKAAPPGELSVLSSWLGITAFAFQIYFDFSGYSDMAVGLGKMFGFNLPINFNYPYISRSVTEFWRRWHISLGSWFREYVYIPLGGNRKGMLKQYRNILIVWFLTGLWHGASWNFVLWGLYYGAFLAVEKTFLLRRLEGLPRAVGHIYTLFVVIVGWVLFEFETIPRAAGFLAAMLGPGAAYLWDRNALYYLYTNGILLLVLAICATPLPGRAALKIRRRLGAAGAAAAPAAYLILAFLCTAYLVNESYNPFLYFRF
ncbi:alginate O-acetylation protein AlgI [Thermacetogenium phaeum DSM 12270]|jgi:alginate O-acetyltransferase complex protein AlgI|uniref:Alginate O-acetylation protein AlgI n=2 Tax=Thermacetogenium phaeum TaxID=85874 RepID=K4LCW0_THEPS|nr:MBOAT family O-acyltransferase [Thermacetogenium phaeum]AFV10613.1 alginate O-acetylation protein AlgI [Thermacetogenium phaeum DSM 12270]KUK36428.1 MAG: Alginate O-acetylation protein AlgI [Thermacetogenium phaeum]MDK2880277.1 alginate O-acetyltransferase complex protein AlgI [Clostridia bacterium]MDN5366347.1 alginate O-acetyltransferase complex protein AlgI [Thermacetogenium sp.]